MDSLRSQLQMTRFRRLASKHTAPRTETVVESTTEIVDELPTNLRTFPSPTCLICKDAGYLRADVPFGHPDFGKALPCSCKVAAVKVKHQQELVQQSGILGLGSYKNATFETFNRLALGTRDAFVAARDFAKDPYGWLVLTGGTGCGKTHLAVSIAKIRIEVGDTVLMQTVPDLLDELRTAFNPKNEESFNERFQEMRSVDVLFLDDYGAENTTIWAAEKLFQILNYRYNADLPTVITSNGLDGIDFRIRSRLSDKQKVVTVDMADAQDYRPNKERGK